MDDFFAEMEAKQNTLFEQLENAPIGEIKGIVDSMGVAGVSIGQGNQWSISLTLEKWRVDSLIKNAPLTVRRKVSKDELHQLQEAIDSDTIIKIRARLLEENIFDSPQALLEELIETNVSDQGLQEKLEELQEPKTFQDEVFGEFTFDRRVDWYCTKTEWGEVPIELNLSLEDDAEVEKALKTAHTLWEQQALWDDQIKEYAVKELLELKNDAWVEDEEEEVSKTEFLSLMTLETVTVYPNGDFEFWHGDGDLFWGHSIKVSCSLSGGITSAGIEG